MGETEDEGVDPFEKLSHGELAKRSSVPVENTEQHLPRVEPLESLENKIKHGDTLTRARRNEIWASP